MSLIERLGSIEIAISILKNDKAFRATHYDSTLDLYLNKSEYKSIPWYEIVYEDTMLTHIPYKGNINLDSLIDVYKLSTEVKLKLTKPAIDKKYVIFCKEFSAYITNNSIGKATYYSLDIDEAIRLSANQALSIIINMKQSDSIKNSMEILEVL